MKPDSPSPKPVIQLRNGYWVVIGDTSYPVDKIKSITCGSRQVALPSTDEEDRKSTMLFFVGVVALWGVCFAWWCEGWNLLWSFLGTLVGYGIFLACYDESFGKKREIFIVWVDIDDEEVVDVEAGHFDSLEEAESLRVEIEGLVAEAKRR